MVRDSERQQFMALYNRVFEPDGITPKNCTRYACIDLIQFCDIIVHIKGRSSPNCGVNCSSCIIV